jgi:hypothetical protein
MSLLEGLGHANLDRLKLYTFMSSLFFIANVPLFAIFHNLMRDHLLFIQCNIY